MKPAITNPFAADCLLPLAAGGQHYSLPALDKHLGAASRIRRLPVALRIVLESLLRNCDGQRVTEAHVMDLAQWSPNAPRETEIPFVVGRIVLQDVAGVPLLGDLAAMRDAAAIAGLPAARVSPQVPVDMVIDHSINVDHHGTPDAMEKNLALEFSRNEERFRFAKWAMQAFEGIGVIPPGFGILHQVNLEHLARGLLEDGELRYPDTLVGTDSHTGMIAGLGVVGWGVGGIEAEAAMLGQPVSFLTPDVIGVQMNGRLRPGVTATDLVLHVTQMLRGARVVGKFIEFFGEGVANLSVPDRATVSNMAPEYGPTVAFFPFDEQTARYLRETGRPEARIREAEAYFRAQGCYGSPAPGSVDYSQVLQLDLGAVEPCVAGPKRPQDRVPLPSLKTGFARLLAQPTAAGGYGRGAIPSAPRQTKGPVRDGDVVIAAITSCTNTSNPGVMLAAGLLAKKAVERGLSTQPWVKTSLTPGSLVVSRYLESAGLQKHLDRLGFAVAGYGCATCMGNSGPLNPGLETDIAASDAVACAVLSGNRNFEARIHPQVKAAYLMSPPLVVAFAIAGTVHIDLTTEPLGRDAQGRDVYLRDLWPDEAELSAAMAQAVDPETYRKAYAVDFHAAPLWQRIERPAGATYQWSDTSSYIRRPPYFTTPALGESSLREFRGARALAILGDSITTDHISPVGNIKASSDAGEYLHALGVAEVDYNSYGARRMNHEVMIRGTFANVRLRNLMAPGSEGPVTLFQPGGERMSIHAAAMRYAAQQVPAFVFAGEEYGTGSARDWAAKGTRLLGVRAVIARSFERIHRSNLAGMGVLPCQLPEGVTAATLGLDGSEGFDLIGLDDAARPRQLLKLVIHRQDGRQDTVELVLRLDTRIEIEYARRGGILNYVLEALGKAA
jgi:aconitate hydratase